MEGFWAVEGLRTFLFTSLSEAALACEHCWAEPGAGDVSELRGIFEVTGAS